jgi:hypothetical protein
MNTRTAVAITAVSALAVGIAGTLAFTALTAPPAYVAPTPTVAMCATEDDTACFWAADKQGNGQGESFYVDANGNAYYLRDDADVTAYGTAVKALRDAGERGDDLLPYLIELAEVDNSIRFAG